jgi:cytochrome c peroxidase
MPGEKIMKKGSTIPIAILVGGFLFMGLSVSKAQVSRSDIEMLDKLSRFPGDLGPLPEVPVPADNPQTPDKVALGKMLFVDGRLSLGPDGKSSCLTCHIPEKAYATDHPTDIGAKGPRNTPTLLNAAYNKLQMWDGRFPSLEAQALSVVKMGLAMSDGITRLRGYKEQFHKVFGTGEVTAENMAKAIAAFERTLTTPNSPFDRYARGDKSALNESEKRGLFVFLLKGACIQCHKGINFTDEEFHNLGVPPRGPDDKDPGRFGITQKEEDRGRFKTPGLRNVALTPPYMHNGVFKTLEEVIEFYNKGGGDVPGKSERMKPLNLTDEEKKDLMAFLKTLTGELPKFIPPSLPAE